MSSDPIGGQLLLQVVLILLNAFFAATEIAVISLNENRLRRQAEEGDKKAASLVKIVEMPTAFLSTIQIGITLAGFLGSAFAADNFAGRITAWLVDGVGVTALSRNAINTISVILITLILSYFTLILGELVPKRIAMQKTEAVARMSAGVITVLAKVMKPIIWLLTVSTNGVLRLCRIDPHKSEEEVSEDEIMMMVDAGEEKGVIEAEEKEMIENVFEFNNLTAEDVMVHRTDMKMVWLEDSKEEILKLIRDTGLSRFPVCGEDADDVKGILSTREYLLNAQEGDPRPLIELVRPAYFVPETIPTNVLFRGMQQMKNHMAVVVDEYGGTSGLVTMEDLLETIVGDIYDEFDPAEEGEIVKIGPDAWKIAGSADLKSIAEELDVELPLDESDTLAGLIMSALDAVPKDGTQPEMNIYGLSVKVGEVKNRRIEWAKVVKLPPAEEN